MQKSWIRRSEHVVFRALSVLLSAVSAHAILWFYSSMDKVNDSDFLQPFVKWGLAITFTALGYFVSRGLVHRMLNKESIKVYVVIGVLLELVEFSANFAQAAVSVHSVDWLRLFDGGMLAVLQAMVYCVMPITPFFTFALAVVDMDLDRAKQGYTVRAFGSTLGNMVASAGPSVNPNNGIAKAGVRPVGNGPAVGPKSPARAPYAPGSQTAGPPTVALPTASMPSMPVPAGMQGPASSNGQGYGNALANVMGRFARGGNAAQQVPVQQGVSSAPAMHSIP